MLISKLMATGGIRRIPVINARPAMIALEEATNVDNVGSLLSVVGNVVSLEGVGAGVVSVAEPSPVAGVVSVAGTVSAAAELSELDEVPPDDEIGGKSQPVLPPQSKLLESVASMVLPPVASESATITSVIVVTGVPVTTNFHWPLVLVV